MSPAIPPSVPWAAPTPAVAVVPPTTVVRCRICQQEHRQVHRNALHTHSLHVHHVRHGPLVTPKAHVCLLLTSAHVTLEATGTASCPGLVHATPRPADHGWSLTILRHYPTCQGHCVTLRRSIILRHHLAAEMRQAMVPVLVAGGLTYTQPSLCLPRNATTLGHLPTPESCKRYRANPVLTPDSGIYPEPPT